MKITAAFLTPTNRRAIGRNLQRSYPVENTSRFDDLLKAIDKVTRLKLQ